MSRYRPISIRMWGDDKFLRLSKPQPNAQTLWVYLISGQHTTPLPGAFVAGEAALAESLGWPISPFRKAFAEVLAQGMAETDRTTRLVFLPKAVIHNPPQSPNVVIAWKKAFDELPDCPLKARIHTVTVDNMMVLGLSEAYVKAFGEAFTYTLPPPFAESEQEQEQNKNRTDRGGKAPSAPPADLISLGEFGWVRVTAEQRAKLVEHLGVNLQGYVDRFDRWVNEAPDVKAGNVLRRNRHAYETIRNWYDTDLKAGKVGATGEKRFISTAEKLAGMR